MKKRVWISLFMIIALALSLASCETYKVVMYQYGVEHGDKVKVKVSNDAVNERLIVEYTVSDSYKENYISLYYEFSGTIGDKDYNYNSKGSEDGLLFKCTDATGRTIAFDDNGDYNFYGSAAFYLSYADANEEIKEICKTIDKENSSFILYLSGESYISYNETVTE